MIAAKASGGSLTTSSPILPNFSRRSGSDTILIAASDSFAIIGAGVPAGASSPNHDVTSKSATPASIMVGSSGMLGERVRAVMARPRSLPSRTVASTAPAFCERHGDASADHVGEVRAAIGNVHDVEAGLGFEHFAGDVLRRSGAGARIGELAGLRPGERDQLGDGLHRHVVVDRQNARRHQEPRDRREVALRIERRVRAAATD